LTESVASAKPEALVVIDLQNIMFNGAVLPPMPNGQTLLNTVAKLIGKARRAKVPVVYVRHNDSAGGPMAIGAEGWQIAEAVSPQPTDTIIEKQFADSFLRTNLHETLLSIGAKCIAFCGAQTEFCVDTTVRSAKSHGFEPMLVSDAHGTFDTVVLKAEQIITHHNLTLRAFSRLLKADQLFPEV
jgi:nicotinamidase-related amidase